MNENKMASFVNVRIKAKVKTLSPSNLLDSDRIVYYRGGEKHATLRNHYRDTQ